MRPYAVSLDLFLPVSVSSVSVILLLWVIKWFLMNSYNIWLSTVRLEMANYPTPTGSTLIQELFGYGFNK